MCYFFCGLDLFYWGFKLGGWFLVRLVLAVIVFYWLALLVVSSRDFEGSRIGLDIGGVVSIGRVFSVVFSLFR